MKVKTWRDSAAPIIAEVIKNNQGLPIPELRKEISKHYPFGERKYFPYKVWCDEVKKQLGLKKRKGEVKDPAQSDLFA